MLFLSFCAFAFALLEHQKPAVSIHFLLFDVVSFCVSLAFSCFSNTSVFAPYPVEAFLADEAGVELVFRMRLHVARASRVVQEPERRKLAILN